MRALSLALVVALTGCAAFQPAPEPDPLVRAETIGTTVGQLTCLAIVVERPEARPDVAKVAAKITAVLASPDPTAAGVAEAINLLPNPDDRLVAAAAVNSIITVLTVMDNPVPALPKDSPAHVGLAAFVAACEKAIIVPEV
jgi:hypothetical protein